MNIIEINNLGKKYKIASLRDAQMAYNYGSLRESLYKSTKKLSGGLLNFFKAHTAKHTVENEFWALQDINFDVKEGQCLGIIGRNGAGKSTLLKLLSGITVPDTGRISLYGRTAVLLEVGTGMHPELTGRENIFFSGAVLGMTRSEISRKFDEIVDFAEIEDFLEVPLKRYSSGMYVRLAFSVAAHLEPEILMMDEVLAVGDAKFQKKCLGKMRNVARNGRTVLFVSHDLGAVRNLCDECVLLDKGKLLDKGPTADIIDSYLKLNNAESRMNLHKFTERSGKGELIFSKLEMFNSKNENVSSAVSGEKISFKLHYEAKEPDREFKNTRISLGVSNNRGDAMLLFSSEMYLNEEITLQGSGSISCTVDRFPLSKGMYYISMFVESNKVVQDYIDTQIPLEVIDGMFFRTGKSYPQGWAGKTVMVDHSWGCES
jgi:lipopolysaccharide transport system ATP-binding protein